MAFVQFSAICTSCMYSSRFLWGLPASAPTSRYNGGCLCRVARQGTGTSFYLPSRMADLKCPSARPMLRMGSSKMSSIGPGTATATVITISHDVPLQYTCASRSNAAICNDKLGHLVLYFLTLP